MRLHTKEVHYYALAVASLGASLLFSYRAGIVYYAVFLPLAGHWVSLGFGSFIFFTLGIAEFVASFQASKKARNWVIGIVVAHDAGSVVYTLFNNQGFSLVLLILAVGMTIVSTLPFFFGHWMQEFAPLIANERKTRHNDWLASVRQRMEKRAVQLVEKEAYKDPEKLRKFAPPLITEYVEGQGSAIYSDEEQGRIAFPAGRTLHSVPVTPVPGAIPREGYYGPSEEDVEAEYTQEDYRARTEPFQKGKTS